MRILFALILISLATACSHPLEIAGEGDITSSTGVNNCSLEDQPCSNIVTGDYNVSYSAVPRDGWRFVEWLGCGNQFPECSFDIPAAVVRKNWLKTMTPLVAVFAPIHEGKPNILTIMVDDLGFNDLAINNGNTGIHTPNMDQLAQEGVRFTRHYAATVCSPARAAFLTGLYPERLGYLPNGRGISPQVETLADRLQAEGYNTWHIGKWHIGDLDRIAWPDYQGFDHWFGFLNQWRLAGVHVAGELQLSTPRYENPWLEGDEVPGQHYTGHLENILTDKAVEVLSDLNTAQDPWFLNLWYYAPHGPISPAGEFAMNYPDTDDGRYRALIEQLDSNIGRVISQLEIMGVIENTIIVIVSDNGGSAGRLDAGDNNAPYYGYKGALTEGGLRTPLIIRWPGGELAGEVFAETIGIEDIFPTVLAATDVLPPQGIDGESFYQSIRQLEPAPQKVRFWELGTSTYGVLSLDGLRRYFQPSVYGIELEPVLYDLSLDPTGSTPTLPIPLAEQAQMKQSYSDWYRDVHVVETDYAVGGVSDGVLTGMDLLRTPGFGTYTFGIGIADDFNGQVAAQQGIWEINRIGNTVMAEFGDMILSGDIDGTAGCHSIVVTGVFERRVSNVSTNLMRLALYIDGHEAQSGEIESVLMVADPTVETIIGDPGIASNGAISQPIILNSALNSSLAWGVESFSQELCSGG